MRVLPSGSTGLLVEVADLDQVIALYTALSADPLPGVVDLVPAGRTILVVTDPLRTTLAAVEAAVRTTTPRTDAGATGELIEISAVYDGDDLEDAAGLLGVTVADLITQHTGAEWTVAFSGFAPGFGYLVSPGWAHDVPRLTSPRTKVPPGAVGLAGQFSGVYPRESPGGWQLIGRTDVAVFDLAREPAALLRPGTRVRFVDSSAGERA